MFDVREYFPSDFSKAFYITDLCIMIVLRKNNSTIYSYGNIVLRNINIEPRKSKSKAF